MRLRTLYNIKSIFTIVFTTHGENFSFPPGSQTLVVLLFSEKFSAQHRKIKLKVILLFETISNFLQFVVSINTSRSVKKGQRFNDVPILGDLMLCMTRLLFEHSNLCSFYMNLTISAYIFRST